jgi:hypothetical protein
MDDPAVTLAGPRGGGGGGGGGHYGHPDAFDRVVVADGPSGVAFPRWRVVDARAHSATAAAAAERAAAAAAANEAGLAPDDDTGVDGMDGAAAGAARPWRAGAKAPESSLYGGPGSRSGAGGSSGGGSGSGSNFAVGGGGGGGRNGRSRSHSRSHSRRRSGSGDSAVDDTVLHAALATVEELSKQSLAHQASAEAAQRRLRSVDMALASLKASYRAAATLAVRRILAAGEHLFSTLSHGSAVFVDSALVMAAQHTGSEDAGVTFAGRFAAEARRWHALLGASVHEWRAEVEAETLPPGAGAGPDADGPRRRLGYEALLDRDGRPRVIPVGGDADAGVDADRVDAHRADAVPRVPALSSYLAQRHADKYSPREGSEQTE